MMTKAGPTSWLTAKRLRAHGWILAICLWSVFVWNLSTLGLRDRHGIIKGADFIHLYTLGSVALLHRTANLYDADAQAQLAAARVPEVAGIRYIPLYPPQVSILLAPLAALPYSSALIVWLLFSVLIYSACCWLIWKTCAHLQHERITVLLLALAFPGFFNLIVWGQTSAIALACFTAAFLFLRDERQFLAGLALGCLMFKPQLGIAAAVVFLGMGAWRVIAGAALSSLAQLFVAAVYYGVETVRAWIHLMLHVAYTVPLLEPRPYQTHSLRTFWTMIVPGLALPFAFYAISSVAVLGLTITVWLRKPSLPLSLLFSMLLLASVLVAPHLIVYDLVILAPAFLLIADWIVAKPTSHRTEEMAILLYLTYLAPLVGPLTRWVHVQISVVLMAVLVCMFWRFSRECESR